ncbi:hypothetical protein [Streptomyces sp. MJM8645]|uniref:hypothetical protein n=1 Tax=Streptomycetaceae TaxID=2062 RepID=UPI0007AF5211|nr:hypothetical protein [Streptomyces sp. MJM8645]
MRPDYLSVLFSDNGFGVTAHVYGPDTTPDRGTTGPDRRYAHVTRPLAQRGLETGVGFGADDYVAVARLPDETFLSISPPPESARPEVPGFPDAWLVTRDHPDNPQLFEVLYDSRPDGPDAPNGGNVPELLASVDKHLDGLGVPSREQVQAARAGAESALHRAGFIPVVRIHETHHRLPAAMVDPGERRVAVTRAVDYLRAEGYRFTCPVDLIDHRLPPALPPSRLLAQVSEAVSAAVHTREVVDALSELTAPGDGVLDQTVAVLRESASWWEGLGGASDPHYAARLRYIADMADGYVREIRAMRGDLADRHTTHPDRTRPAAPAAADGLDTRVLAALATSPTSTRTLTGHPAEAVLAAPAAVRAAGPRR